MDKVVITIAVHPDFNRVTADSGNNRTKLTMGNAHVRSALKAAVARLDSTVGNNTTVTIKFGNFAEAISIDPGTPVFNIECSMLYSPQRVVDRLKWEQALQTALSKSLQEIGISATEMPIEASVKMHM